MAEPGFTFWGNMKEAIDIWDGQPEVKLKLYDALAEYGLYGVEPDITDKDYAIVKMFLQSMLPTLTKSSNFIKNSAVAGEVGGKNCKYSDDNLIEATRQAAIKLQRVPGRKEIVNEYKSLYGDAPTEKTIGRRLTFETITEITHKALNSSSNTFTF